MASRLVAHFNDGKQTLPPVPIAARLSDRVFVALGMNPSAFSLRGTNTYLVGTGPKRILIDTGDADFVEKYLPVLRKAVAEAGAKGIEQIVVTHWHRDHIGGVKAVLEEFGSDIPVRKFMPAEGAEVVWKQSSSEGGVSEEEALSGCTVKPLVDGEVLRTHGATLRVMHTPGHANDHVTLMLEEEQAMFTADNVLGTGTPVFRDLPLYLRSLQQMLAQKPKRLYTSHGPVVEDGQALIQEYISHRNERVQQVREALVAADGKWCTAETITRSIYTQHPEHLIGPATGNSVQALRVLQEAGIVESEVSQGGNGAIVNLHPNAPPESLVRAKWRIIPAKL
eukprot:TRINITY_DN31994_c0_g1_i1.p1 TRINITY_DN31994_c0_g1~~TRINITY_DN31994_c0_g1_i1.p1  ORF type:complete len:338 (-),score=29.09 TRINITY_DN31994_c0_g1_i1:65-1078(-)